MATMTGRSVAWAGVVVRFDDGHVWAVEFDGRNQLIEAELTMTQDWREEYEFGSVRAIPLAWQEVRVELRGRGARWTRGEQWAPAAARSVAAGGPLAIEMGEP